MTKLAVQAIEVLPRSGDADLWQAFSEALYLAIVEAITGRRIIVCAACGCATAFGCALICGDPDIEPSRLPGWGSN